MTIIFHPLFIIVCGETNFESSAALAEHRSKTHMYKCQDCDKEYKLTDSLRNHIRLKHNKNVIMTCCNFCDMVFYDIGLKAGHVSTLHADCNVPFLYLPVSSGSTNLNDTSTTSENMNEKNLWLGYKIGITCIGKKHAFKKWEHFTLNTGCFWKVKKCQYQIKYYPD